MDITQVIRRHFEVDLFNVNSFRLCKIEPTLNSTMTSIYTNKENCLFRKTQSRSGCSTITSSTNLGILSNFEISKTFVETIPLCLLASMLSLPSLRPTATTWQPVSAYFSARAQPMPVSDGEIDDYQKLRRREGLSYTEQTYR